MYCLSQMLFLYHIISSTKSFIVATTCCMPWSPIVQSYLMLKRFVKVPSSLILKHFEFWTYTSNLICPPSYHGVINMDQKNKNDIAGIILLHKKTRISVA